MSESILTTFAANRGARLDHDFGNALNTFVGAMVALRLAGPVVTW
jgi:hypothetical protein